MRRHWSGFMPVAGLAVCTIATAPLLVGQGHSDSAAGRRLKADALYLAAPERLGRHPLGPGYLDAALWAAERFRTLGLEPAGDNGTYFQQVPLTAADEQLVLTSGVPGLVIDGRPFSVLEGDFLVDAHSTAETTVASTVVFVGTGISAPARGFDEYATVDVAGRVVLALVGTPSRAPSPLSLYGFEVPPVGLKPGDEDPWAQESTDAAKTQVAFRHGAAAIMLFDPDQPSAVQRGLDPLPDQSFDRPFLVVRRINQTVFRSIMRRDGQESDRGLDTRIAAIREDLTRGRLATAPTGRQAKVTGYAGAVRHRASLGNHRSPNVLGRLRGAEPGLEREVVVVGAHLDHLGTRDGIVYNGADDNASGAAALLEAARALSAGRPLPARTVVFALWTAEEFGRAGSLYFADGPPSGLRLDDVVAYLNLDMVGTGQEFRVGGGLDFPSLFEIATRGQPEAVVRAISAAPVSPRGSDHASFLVRGVPVLTVTSSGPTAHADYHDPGDDPEKLDALMLELAAAFTERAARNVADAGLPRAPGDRQEGYEASAFRLPDLHQGTGGAWRVVGGADSDDLVRQIREQVARAMRPGPPAPYAAVAERGTPPPALATGLRAAAVGGSAELLRLAADTLGIGRVDISAGDGLWQGTAWTAAGRSLLDGAGIAGLTVHLLRPPPALLREGLRSAPGGLVLTDVDLAADEVALALADRRVILGIQCEPGAVAACVVRASRAADLAGGRQRIALGMAGDAGSAEAVRALYAALRSAGWSHQEIAASGASTRAPVSLNMMRTVTAPRN